MLALSGADRLLPSKSEADRLQKKLPKCKVFFFENHGHSLLLVSSRLLLTLADCIRFQSILWTESNKWYNSRDSADDTDPTFQEHGVHVSSIIKCAGLYRHSSRYHRVFDYIPPSTTELREVDKASR
jgi:hypothetical protein